MQKTPVEMSVSCIGVPTCQIGVEQSQALLRHILEALKQGASAFGQAAAAAYLGCANSWRPPSDRAAGGWPGGARR